jgi:hypothetical protein
MFRASLGDALRMRCFLSRADGATERARTRFHHRGLVAGWLGVKGPCGKLTTAKAPLGESDERSNPTERTDLGRRRLVPSAGPVRRLVPISPPARRALLPPWRRCGSRPPGSRTRSLGRSVARLSASRKSRSI